MVLLLIVVLVIIVYFYMFLCIIIYYPFLMKIFYINKYENITKEKNVEV